MWVGLIGDAMNLDCAGEEKLYIPLSSDRYLLTCRNFLNQTEHNKLEIRRRKCPDLSVAINGSKVLSVLLCSALQTYVGYSMDGKRNLTKLYRLKEMVLPVSVGRGCLHHRDMAGVAHAAYRQRPASGRL